MNQKALECLAKAGCFDAFDIARKGIVDNLERLLDMTSREREQRELGQGFLFDDMPSEALEDELRKAGSGGAVRTTVVGARGARLLSHRPSVGGIR